jgi:hypothetical protein
MAAAEMDEATMAAVSTLGERMRTVLKDMLPEDEAARCSSDACMARWIRANDGDVDAASKGLMNYVQWYTKKPQYGVDDGVLAVAQGKGAELVSSEVATNKAFLIPDAKDTDGRPIILIQVRKHDPSAPEYSVEQLTLFAVYLLESTVAAMVEPVDTLCCIFDLSGIGLSNVDMQAVKRIIFLLTNMYPERLGRCYLLEAPTLFSGCWKLISPMLKPNTTRKIQFVDVAGLAEAFKGDTAVMRHVMVASEEEKAVAEAKNAELQRVSQEAETSAAPSPQTMETSSAPPMAVMM